ncbi:MAG: hypothetical protein ACK4HG_18365, partial [Agrobacterium albertimagni]
NLENGGNIHQFEAIVWYKRLIAWGMGERKLSWLSRLCQDRTYRFLRLAKGRKYNRLELR